MTAGREDRSRIGDTGAERIVAMRRTHRVITVALAAVALGSAPASRAAVAAPTTPPRLHVSAPARGCPAAAGRFVVVLGGSHGMLVLSAERFPGAHRAGSLGSGPLTVKLSGAGDWPLATAEAGTEGGALWAAHYRFLDGGGEGCVAFDRSGFAAVGDLATYVHWLVEKVYLRLPDGTRAHWPALELDGRTVALKVEQPGAGPLDLHGREGGTLAYRTPTGEVVMLQPFILDPRSGTLAIDATMTPAAHEGGTPPQSLGWLVASPAAPAKLEQPAATIQVVEVGSASSEH